MPSAVDSVFDLAFWFSDRALNDNEYLQPIKLQHLLYLTQAYYAVAYNGKRFVPAIFVADETGPIEPSVYRAWIEGRPSFERVPDIPEDAKNFADSVWRRFGQPPAEELGKMCRKSPAYRISLKRGNRAEIHLEEMIKAFTKAHDTPGVDQVVRPKVMRSHKGRPVTVKSWTPPTVKPTQ